VLVGDSASGASPVGWEMLKWCLVLLPKKPCILMSGSLRQLEN